MQYFTQFLFCACCLLSLFCFNLHFIFVPSYCFKPRLHQGEQAVLNAKFALMWPVQRAPFGSVTAHIRQILQALANTNKRSVCWCLHRCNCTFSCYCQIDNFLVLKKLFGFPVISDLRRSDLRGFPLPIKKVVFVFNSFVLKLNKKCAIPCFMLIV